MKARRAWTDVIQTLREHICQPRLLYPAKFLSKGEQGQKWSRLKEGPSRDWSIWVSILSAVTKPDTVAFAKRSLLTGTVVSVPSSVLPATDQFRCGCMVTTIRLSLRTLLVELNERLEERMGIATP